MYMAGSTNRQNEANPAIYPATLASWEANCAYLANLGKKIHKKFKFLSENP